MRVTKSRSKLSIHDNGILKRSFLALAAALYCLLGTPANSQLQAQDQPNIIYIFVDDLSSGMVGFTNPNTPVLTPNIDALAAAGLQFTQAYARLNRLATRRRSTASGDSAVQQELIPGRRALIRYV